MPDVYNRIQAGTKAVTLGAMCFLLGVGFLYPQWWAKLLCHRRIHPVHQPGRLLDHRAGAVPVRGASLGRPEGRGGRSD